MTGRVGSESWQPQVGTLRHFPLRRPTGFGRLKGASRVLNRKGSAPSRGIEFSTGISRAVAAAAGLRTTELS